MAHAVGIDVGSTNTKAVLIADGGEVVASASRPLVMARAGDVAEQDAEATWQAVVATVDELTAAHPGPAADVVAIGVCSQYSSIVPVDTDGRPVAAMRLYLDTRGTPRSRAIMADHPDALGLWLERHGLPPYGSGLSLGHMLHLQHDTPRVHDRTAAWLEPMDYVTARLTGRITATRSTMFAAQLCDNRGSGAPTYDDDLVRRSGIDPTRLPPLVADGTRLGSLRPEVATAIGLPARTVVVAAMNDSQAGALATGAFTPGRVGVVIGTTAVVLAGLDRMALDADHELASMPSPLPGRHLVWAENGIAGRAVEHVLGRLLDPGGADPFAGLEAALAASPPGARGALFLPWLTGSVAPKADPSMRGAFLNLSLDTGPDDLARAAVEGTAHNLAWLLPAVEGFVGRPADEIVFAGGAARSPGWAQVLADVLDRPVSVVRDPAVAGAKAVARYALDRTAGSDGPGPGAGGTDAGGTDAGGTNAGTTDTGTTDTGTTDTGTTDTGTTDTSTTDTGTGVTDTGRTGTDTGRTGTDTGRTGTDTGGTGTDTGGTGTDTGGTDTDTAGTDTGGTDTDTGGTDTGGTDTRGTDTGGTDTGGTDTGRTDTDTGGTDTGTTDTRTTDTDTGGTDTGGTDTAGTGTTDTRTGGSGAAGADPTELSPLPAIAATFAPDASTRAIHRSAQEQFEAAFAALRPLSRARRRRTG